MQMITKEIKDNQLFVFHNGKLIYKKWLNTGNSIVVEEYGIPTWKAQRDQAEKESIDRKKID